MKVFIILVSFFYSINVFACDFLKVSKQEKLNNLMGKKSIIYDAYKQGKCVLEDALKPLTEEQRRVIANLIAKSYKIVE